MFSNISISEPRKTVNRFWSVSAKVVYASTRHEIIFEIHSGYLVALELCSRIVWLEFRLELRLSWPHFLIVFFSLSRRSQLIFSNMPVCPLSLRQLWSELLSLKPRVTEDPVTKPVHPTGISPEMLLHPPQIYVLVLCVHLSQAESLHLQQAL